MSNTCRSPSILGEIIGAVSLRLPEEVTQRLADQAEKTGLSKTFYMIEAIQEHLDDPVDLYLSEQRLISNLDGESASIPFAEIM